MPIPPKPFIKSCPKCGYFKVLRPKSDTDISYLLASKCPKCNIALKKQNFSLSNLFSSFINNIKS